MARPKKSDSEIKEIPKVEEKPQPEETVLETTSDKVSEVVKSDDGMSSHKKFDKFKK
jgi:hypothetical protein